MSVLPAQDEYADLAPAPPPELWDVLGHFGLAAGNANVIMQLARLPVGHGVAHSKVDSGRVDKHPIKRLRTTVSYLAVALLGTEEERRAMRHEVNRAHSSVHSGPSDPVQYNAFDQELQLWVAACLYWGTADLFRLMDIDLSPERSEAVYQYAKRLGTTLQVAEDRWPSDLQAFNEYWEEGLRQIQMDDVTRSYLQSIAQFEFLTMPLGRFGAPLRPLLRPYGRFMTLGYLPEQFRLELGLPWSRRQQRLFDLHIRLYAAVTRRLPHPLREFPFNLYLRDVRSRIRREQPIV